MRDTVNLLRLGVPAVALVHSRFAKLAQLQCLAAGVPNAPVFTYSLDDTAVDGPGSAPAQVQDVAERALELLAEQGRARTLGRGTAV